MFFFLFILLIFLLIIFFFPNYIKKDIVPPLSDANYHIVHTPMGSLNPNNISASTFQHLIISDGTASGTEAIDFGTSEGDTSEISYVPYYSEMQKRLYGFFELNLATKYPNTFLFRVIDSAQSGTIPGTLSSYNRGWTSLNTIDTSNITNIDDALPIYVTRVPFNFPAYVNRNHQLTVQISAETAPGNGSSVQLSSAYLYYQTI